MPTEPDSLARRLRLSDSVLIGLGSMIGAGVFVVFAPAAHIAGSGLLISLALAAVVAWCNATSCARLAALYPASGGTYVYGRERLGPFWGYLAGWSFVVGKTASCAAMALTVGAYLWPGHQRATAIAAVALLTGVNQVGIHRSAQLNKIIVAVTLGPLGVVVGSVLVGSRTDGHSRPSGLARGELVSLAGHSPHALAQAAGLLFFAFAGYARIATLGEEVRDPARTIPRAISLALGLTCAIYAAVAAASLYALGAQSLGASSAPLTAVITAAGHGTLTPLVRIGAATAATGSLLALILGVSRTTFAMARDGHLPRQLAAVHPRFAIPYKAELAVGVAVCLLVSTTDLRGSIGFSSFGVLMYYAIANLSARTLTAAESRPPRWVPWLGLIGCVTLALTLPGRSVIAGAGVLALGACVWLVTRGRQ